MNFIFFLFSDVFAIINDNKTFTDRIKTGALVIVTHGECDKACQEVEDAINIISKSYYKEDATKNEEAARYLEEMKWPKDNKTTVAFLNKEFIPDVLNSKLLDSYIKLE